VLVLISVIPAKAGIHDFTIIQRACMVL
jgi:hypothetical protein